MASLPTASHRGSRLPGASQCRGGHRWPGSRSPRCSPPAPPHSWSQSLWRQPRHPSPCSWPAEQRHRRSTRRARREPDRRKPAEGPRSVETEAGCPAGNCEAGAGDTLFLTMASAAHDVSTGEHAWEATSYVLCLINMYTVRSTTYPYNEINKNNRTA